KVYILRYFEKDREFGSVITGSSNFSEAGLVANREFNVELKDSRDVEFALEQFEGLWKDGVDVSNEYVETINKKTWLPIQEPYKLYLKFLYEYFKEDINVDTDIDAYVPEGFMELEYQKQAVVSAKKIVEAYNGVFLADVVGLGKTYISALLAQQLEGWILIICPPVLKKYWKDTFDEFGIRRFRVESLGMLEHIIKQDFEKYRYIFIDESHRFRNEVTYGYEMLHQICFGKKIILVSATPLNNTIDDIYSQIKLFQVPKKSTIPGVPNLDIFFSHIRTKLKLYKKSDAEYMNIIKEVSKEVREKILKYIMVRRTRSEIKKYFNNDISNQGLTFPELDNPKRIIYYFDSKTDDVFKKTIEKLKKLTYSRYMPLLYLKAGLSEFELQGQRNVGGFMKGLIVKRLESSFYAFKMSLERFILSYEKYINMYNNGTVYISKKIDIYDYLDNDDEEYLLKLIEDEDKRIKRYKSTEFKKEFIEDLYNDLNILKEIQSLWIEIDKDPKLIQFINDLKNDKLLKNNKLVVFSESKETGEYLYKNLYKELTEEILFYCSKGGCYNNESISIPIARDLIKENFDPNSKKEKNDIRIIITTDILSEGINLHRSNIVLNYDLPWNPTKVLQRAGRINRVGSLYDKIYIYNFFPTAQGDEHLGLEDSIKSKIQSFYDTLGEDAKYLTDEEVVTSHELFGDNLYKRLNDRKNFEGEDEENTSELEYLKIIRDVRDNSPELFETIKRLPKKARSCKMSEIEKDRLISFFRKGMLKKIFITDGIETNELAFLEAVELFKCNKHIKKEKMNKKYYDFLQINKKYFENATTFEKTERIPKAGRSNESYIIKRLKANDMKMYKGFTEDEEDYIKKVLNGFENGIIPQKTSQKIKRAIEKEINPIKVIMLIKRNIPYNILNSKSNSINIEYSPREVILSEYLIKKGSKNE
ncbi:MAG: helicase, partial [Spirochaetes bacterium]|nr:helicase [Spirochaetota bacterium]